MSSSKCRVCGCTNEKACMTRDGPCYWINDDLCSACALNNVIMIMADTRETFSAQDVEDEYAEMSEFSKAFFSGYPELKENEVGLTLSNAVSVGYLECHSKTIKGTKKRFTIYKKKVS